MNAEKFFTAYVTAALWSSTDDGSQPLDDKHSAADIAPTALAKMRADCCAFIAQHDALLANATDDELAGHDFWLSRNGHGAGFFDGTASEYGANHKSVCADLQKAAQKFGSCDLYVGDDGKIYA